MIKFFWRSKTNSKLFYFGIVLSILSSLASVYLSLLLGRFVDNLHVRVDLGAWIVPFIGLLIVQTITMGISQYLLSKFGANIFRNVQSGLYKKLISSKFTRISTQSAGSWSSHLTTDILSIRSILSEQLPEVLVAMIKLTVITAIIIYLDWYILIPIVLFSLIMLGIVLRVGERLDRYSEIGQRLIAKLSSLINDSVLNIKTIKAFRKEKFFVNKNLDLLGLIFNNHLRVAKTLSIGLPIINSLVFTLIISLVFLGSLQVSSEYISLGGFLTLSVLLLEALPELMTILSSFSEFQEAHGQLKFVIRFIGDSSETEEIQEYEKDSKEVNELTFVDVSSELNGKKLFIPISFTAKPGDILIIRGQSGIGKTHLFDSIMRFNEGISGTICIDGKNIGELDTLELREYFAYGTAEDRLITGNIKGNIFTNELSVKKITNSSSDTFLRNLSDNLEDSVINMGDNYSKGQKRKIKNLSVLLSNSPIILLDEPTSGLDIESKKDLYNILRRFNDKIVIIISHDNDDLVVADKVIELLN